MHTISDAIFWRGLILATVLAILFAGVAISRLIASIRRRRQQSSVPQRAQASRNVREFSATARQAPAQRS